MLQIEDKYLHDAAYYAVKGFIHKTDHGAKYLLSPTTANTNAKLDALHVRKDKTGVSFFNKKMMGGHLFGKATYYYRADSISKRTTGYGRGQQWQKAHFCSLLGIESPIRSTDQKTLLICVDIDVHDGQSDGRATMEFVSRFFGGNIYFEPSTNGKGWHGYLKIEHAPGCNDAFKKFNDYLRQHLLENGFQSTVDIVGTPTVWGKNRVRGQLAKIPRFQWHGDDLAGRMSRVQEFYMLEVVPFEVIAKYASMAPPKGTACQAVPAMKAAVSGEVLQGASSKVPDLAGIIAMTDTLDRKRAYVRHRYRHGLPMDFQSVVYGYFTEISKRPCMKKDQDNFTHILDNFNPDLCKLPHMAPFVVKYRAGGYDLRLSEATLRRYGDRNAKLNNDGIAQVLFVADALAVDGLVQLGRGNFMTTIERYLGKKVNKNQYQAIMKLLLAEGFLILVCKGYLPGKKCKTYRVNLSAGSNGGGVPSRSIY